MKQRWLVLSVFVCLMACSKEESLEGETLRPSGHPTDSEQSATSDIEVDRQTNDESDAATSSSSRTEPQNDSNTADTTMAADTEETSNNDLPSDTGSQMGLPDADSDGWSEGQNMDCDDADPNVNPEAPEVTGNSKDDDCDGFVDEEPDSETQACDGEDFAIELLPPKLMLLLDMSGSMTETPPNPTKWEQALSALNNLVSTKQDQIEFGLDVFPDDGNCGVDAPVIRDVAKDAALDILSYLSTAPVPEGEALTPLCKALLKFADAATYAPQLVSGNAEKYLVLVSDGEDRCGGKLNVCQNILGLTTSSHLEKVTARVLAQGIHTFVIGFGQGVSPSQLNAIAAAGGTPLDTYLDAADQSELEAALGTIASQIESCTFELKSPNASADPEKVNFYFGDDPVPLDPGCALGNGWDWADAAHTAITLCPQACQKLGSGTYGPLTAEFGCKQIAN